MLLSTPTKPSPALANGLSSVNENGHGNGDGSTATNSASQSSLSATAGDQTTIPAKTTTDATPSKPLPPDPPLDREIAASKEAAAATADKEAEELAKQIAALDLAPQQDAGEDSTATSTNIAGDPPPTASASSKQLRKEAAEMLDDITDQLTQLKSEIFLLEEVRHTVVVMPAAVDGEPNRGEAEGERTRRADQLMISLDERLEGTSKLFARLEAQLAVLQASKADAPDVSGNEQQRKTEGGEGEGFTHSKRLSVDSLASMDSFEEELFLVAAGGRGAAEGSSGPTLSALQKRVQDESKTWFGVQEEVELLRRELVEDKQLAVVEGTMRHAEGAMDSLEKAVNAAREMGWKCTEQVQALQDWKLQREKEAYEQMDLSSSSLASGSAPHEPVSAQDAILDQEEWDEKEEKMRELIQDLKETRRKLEVKRGYYFPSIEQAFVGLEAILKNRVTSNGHLVRRRHELSNRWKSLRESVGKFERELSRSERKLRTEIDLVFSRTGGTGTPGKIHLPHDVSMESLESSSVRGGAALPDSPSNASSLSIQSTGLSQGRNAGTRGAAPDSPSRPSKSILRTAGGAGRQQQQHTPPTRTASLNSLSQAASTPPNKPSQSNNRNSMLVGSGALGLSAGPPSRYSSNITRATPATANRSVVHPATEPPGQHSSRVSSRRAAPSPSPVFGRSAAQPPPSSYSTSWQPRSSTLEKGLPIPARPSSRNSELLAPRSRSRQGSEPPLSDAERNGSSPGGWRARVEARLAAKRDGDESFDSYVAAADSSFASSTGSTAHHHQGRSGSSLGFSSESPSAVARPRNNANPTRSRPMSMLGSYYRPPSSTAQQNAAEMEMLQGLEAEPTLRTTDRAAKRQSFIPRLSGATAAPTGPMSPEQRSVSLSQVRRPGSALSNASNDSHTQSSRVLGLSPARHRPSNSTGSSAAFGRLTMQTPEPIIAARAQRLSMFAKPSGAEGFATAADAIPYLGSTQPSLLLVFDFFLCRRRQQQQQWWWRCRPVVWSSDASVSSSAGRGS